MAVRAAVCCTFFPVLTRAWFLALLTLEALTVCTPAAAQDYVFFRGKVTLEDGSLPDHSVTVQRVCYGLQQPVREALTNRKTGEYVVRLFVSHLGQVFSGMGGFETLPCSLEASATGMVSSRIDLTDRRMTQNPRLPDLILTPKSQAAVFSIAPPAGLPRAAARHWERAVKHLTSRDWSSAEAPLRAAVAAAPKFAAAWSALGNVCAHLGQAEEARHALETAIALDAKPLASYQMLSRILLDLKDWPAVLATTGKLIEADSKHVYVEAYLFHAVALYQTREFDQALARVDEALRLDRLHELKRAEYVRGLILEAKGDLPAAEKSLRAYLAANPRAKEAETVRQRLANLGQGPPADLSAEFNSLDLSLAAAGESPVPGGIKAFSAVAQLPGAPAAHDLFLEYCRAVITGRPDMPSRTREAREEVRAFIAAMAVLERLGERTENGTLIRLATASDAAIAKTRTLLAELGWRLVARGDGYAIETGDRPGDGLRQRALAALGVEELDLRNALAQRREFTFEIPRETARLVGGTAWGLVLKDVPEYAGGPVEAFIRDARFARVYLGLGAMDADSAAALVSAVGLPNLLVKHSALTAAYAGAIELNGPRVAVPGGTQAEPIWARLAGAPPQPAAPFLRALFEKDQGRLLAFYHHLARAGAPQQQFFTRTPERAEAFYRWFREAGPPPASYNAAQSWHARLLQSLPVDASGRVHFPGGREVWGPPNESDEDILLRRAPLEAFIHLAQLEQRRGTPLSPASARLLAPHDGEWQSLFGYFEQLPALDEPAFRALEEFATAAAAAPESQREQLLGQWHSLVQLIVLGSQAGSLSPAQAEQAFRQTCAALRGANASSAALAVLRGITGESGSLDDALAGRLLRLSGPRREAFETVRKLQDAPRLSALEPGGDPAKTLAALSGAVYAALLDPSLLLVATDRQLLRKHRFISPDRLFPPSSLVVSNQQPGSNFQGGFASFAEASLPLRERTVGAAARAPEPSASPSTLPLQAPHGADTPFEGAADVVFEARGRVVEVYATVTDGRGRYVDNLTKAQFTILEEGAARPAVAFESYLAGVSVALLFDTTGSMAHTLPQLKAAALQLLDELRAVDSVAVYNFDETVTAALPFTGDKEAAKRAILKLHPCGTTGLYEALVRVNHDLASRTGKKVIVVFTDGADNASMLSSELAIESAKERGVPIYTIAQGQALLHVQLVAELDHIARATGGTPFLIRQPADIAEVFARISQDLMHGYLVAFQPTPGENRVWRKIEVLLNGSKGLRVRAREGFYVE